MKNICLILFVLFTAPLFAQEPSFIPMPQQLNYTNQQFNSNHILGIQYRDSSLKMIASQLQEQLHEFKLMLPLQSHLGSEKKCINLELDTTGSVPKKAGAYQLNIRKDAISISSASKEGVQNAIQTLLQWFRSPKHPTCQISDWPAFEWRGFMIDVGRNYVPLATLKQLVDKMAFYKLNVFHFHATEDIAWRIEIKQYPQLTSAENMLRNKGEFYSVSDIKSLIQYCKSRNIKFIPEIDMPGHSAAFKRAFQVDMQSDEGIKILKNILKEICSNYDIDYLHIGADEVKITNKNFIPCISTYIQSLGKKIIGWQPGGNFTNNTIR